MANCCTMCEGTGQAYGRVCAVCEGTGQILTEADVQKLPLIHTFVNKWRQRWVYIHEHPLDADKVVTMGYPMAAGGGVAFVPPVICVEQKEAYRHVIGYKVTVCE